MVCGFKASPQLGVASVLGICLGILWKKPTRTRTNRKRKVLWEEVIEPTIPLSLWSFPAGPVPGEQSCYRWEALSGNPLFKIVDSAVCKATSILNIRCRFCLQPWPTWLGIRAPVVSSFSQEPNQVYTLQCTLSSSLTSQPSLWFTAVFCETIKINFSPFYHSLHLLFFYICLHKICHWTVPHR